MIQNQDPENTVNCFLVLYICTDSTPAFFNFRGKEVVLPETKQDKKCLKGSETIGKGTKSKKAVLLFKRL